MNRYARPLAFLGVALLAACGGGGGSVAPSSPIQSVPQSVAAQAVDVAPYFAPSTPLVVHVGFSHAALKKSAYGPVAYYAPTAGKTAIITVAAGSSIQFFNDDTTKHTASGLGDTKFPKEFDNKSGIKAVGTTINGTLTWASGSLNPQQTSKTFTVGPKGTYYFGCYYHYHVTPNMRDVIVSQ